MKYRLLILAVALAAGGCATSSQQTISQTLDKAPLGASSDLAMQRLHDEGYFAWNSGRLLYGYRDTDFLNNAASSGASLQANLDPQDNVISSAADTSPTSPYPLLCPTYP